MRPSTISVLVRELLSEGKLIEAGPSDNPTGRKQVLLRVNEEFGCVAGIEFDAEFVVAAVMDLHPTIRARVKEPVRLDAGVDGLVNQLYAALRAALEQAQVDRKNLLGIALADPGLVDSREVTSVTCSTIDFWRDVPVGRMFEHEFGVQCLLESNTRARATAERFAGAGEMSDDMIYVDFGAGVGAGIITEGRILRGHRESAGELGHTHVSEGGAACSCGSFGCLEAIAGAPALAARVRRAIDAGSSSRALELAGSDPRSITGWTVLEAARLGDKTCDAVTEDLGNYLGLA
ncbi:MAG: ROK family protein, partial [Gammaproteobacteria bacterium]